MPASLKPVQVAGPWKNTQGGMDTINETFTESTDAW